MHFAQTGLPDRQVLRVSFTAGWGKYAALSPATRAATAARYHNGPVAMARLVLERGGDAYAAVAAACLAGPAVFSTLPDSRLDHDVLLIAHEVMAVEDTPAAMRREMIGGMSVGARLFMQVSAVMLLDTLASVQHEAGGTLWKTAWEEGLELYAAARGMEDSFGLDTRFEIAARKVMLREEAAKKTAARGDEWSAAQMCA